MVARTDPLVAPRARAFGLARSRRVAIFGLALVLLAVALVFGVGMGSVSLAPTEVIGILARRLLGLSVPQTWPASAEAIVMDIRLPRVLSAMVVGLGLAVAGATFQGLLRNPLADPYVLGTASGAALGAAIAVLIPVRIVIFEFGLLQGLAFAGALIAVFTVYQLSRTSGAGMTALLLTGYAVGSLLAAGLAMAMYLSGANLRQIFFYLLGSLDGASWDQFWVAMPIVLLGSLAILLRARSLDGLLLGEDAAAHLGVNVRRERAMLLALASLITAAAVTLAGLIGFIGLVVPHVVRLVVGPSARSVLPLSALFGASLLTLADLGARLFGEIPVGVVTAVFGAPFFLFLLRRSRSAYEL